jgi:hypothetical protein
MRYTPAFLLLAFGVICMANGKPFVKDGGSYETTIYGIGWVLCLISIIQLPAAVLFRWLEKQGEKSYEGQTGA